MSRPRYDRTVPSDGMTVDSPFGPIDPVAVDRIIHGHPTPITRADSVHLTSLLTGSYEQAQRIADALGCSRETVLKRLDRRRAAADRGSAA